MKNLSRGMACSLVVLAIAAAGCSGARRLARDRRGAAERIVSSRTPTFLTGPAAPLLAKAGNYSAYLTMEMGPTEAPVEGTLLCRDGKLLFARAPGKGERKRDSGGGFSFIWDTSAGAGDALSEALQGYAPVNGAVTFTNVSFYADTNGWEKTPGDISGHPCEHVQATVRGSDGSLTVFRVWRATDLNGMALRIVSMSDPAGMSLTLSRPRIEPVDASLFQPASGFTKYDNTEAMLNEILIRQQNVRKKESSETVTDTGEGEAPKPPKYGFGQ